MIRFDPITNRGPTRHGETRAPQRASPLLLGASLALLSILSGCAIHKQVQYFAATDPDSGLTNYYKMTVTGSGGLGTDYHIQAGYFSSAAVDMLRGSMPNVPILDLPLEQLEVFDRLTQHFYAALIQEAKRVHGVSDPEAILIAAKSGRAMAERRLGKHEARLARAQRELSRATSRVDSTTSRVSKAQTRSEELSTVAADLESEIAAADSDVEDKSSEVEDAQATLEDAKTTRADEQGSLDEATTRAEERNGAAEEAETLASSDPSEANQEAAQAARQAADEAAELAQTVETELDQPVKDAETALSQAEEALAAARKNLKQARGKIDQANGREAEARRKLRDAEASLAAAERAVDRAQGKLDLQQVEVTRNQAARDAAIEMMDALNAKLEFDPFSPLAEGADSQVFDDPKIIQLARVVWFGSLSSSDLASIGMTGTTNPYQFRKLVFWATATNIDLNEFAGEIDGIMDNVVGIATAMKTQHQQLKNQAKSRRTALDGIIDQLPLPPGQRDMLRGFMDIADPSAVDDEATTAGEGS